MVREQRGMARNEALYQELRRLCRGRGVLAPDLNQAVGPQLAAWLRDRSVSVLSRRSISELLEAETDVLPSDLRDAARVALALHPSARQRFLNERLGWLAADADRDVRTVRRRMEEALSLLAELMTAPGGRATERDDVTGPECEWHVADIRALVRLDAPQIEVIEERTISVTRGRVETVPVAVSLPPPDAFQERPCPAVGGGTFPAGSSQTVIRNAPPEERGLSAEVLYGARLLREERPSVSHFRFILALPRTFHEGDTCTWAMRFSLPAGQPMAPHYALTPFGRCVRYAVRVRFSAERPPQRIWLLDGVPPRMIDDPPDGLRVVEPDGAYEVGHIFHRLTPGIGYGFRWQPEPQSKGTR